MFYMYKCSMCVCVCIYIYIYIQMFYMYISSTYTNVFIYTNVLDSIFILSRSCCTATRILLHIYKKKVVDLITHILKKGRGSYYTYIKKRSWILLHIY